MKHPIQKIFRNPLFANRETVSFCKMIFPELVWRIQKTADNARALNLLRTLVSAITRHGLPDDVREKHLKVLMRIMDYAQQIDWGESPEEEVDIR